MRKKAWLSKRCRFMNNRCLSPKGKVKKESIRSCSKKKTRTQLATTVF